MTAATSDSTPNLGRSSSGWRFASATWPALVWLVALARVHALHETFGLRSAATWGLMILGSFVAWGAALTRTLSPKQRFGWGFDGAIGMAMTLSVFGALAAVRLVSVGSILAWCIAGPLAYGAVQWHHPGPVPAGLRWTSPEAALAWAKAKLTKPRPVPFYVGVVVLCVMAGLQYVDSIMNVAFNVWDDNMAYRMFAREFLDTGTLLDSYSYRRIGGYGGQSLLQAFVLALTDRNRLHMVDDGLCVLLILGLVLGFRTRPGWTARAGILAAGLLVMTLPYTPHNTASAQSGVVFFLALYRLFDQPGFERASSRSNAILAGLLVAAVCTLRQNFISAAFVFPGLMYLGLVLWPPTTEPDPTPRAAWFKQACAAIGAAVLFLSPWMITSYIATGTPFYPVFKGYLRPDFGLMGRVTPAELFRWSIENVFFFKPISTIALFFMAAFALPFNRRNRAIHAFLFCSLLSFLMMMWFFQTFDQTDSIARYYFAFTVAFCAAATLRGVADAAQSKRIGEAFVAGAMVTVAVGLQFVGAKDTVKDLYVARVTSLQSFWRTGGVADAPSELDALYGRIQGSVPAGAKILVMLDHSYLLDGKRNAILNYDHPGAMGPMGGPPDFKGPEAFATWLHANGVRYIAFQLGPSSVEYSHNIWEPRLAAAAPREGRGGFYKKQATFELDFFGVLEALERTRNVIFRDHEIRVLDVESPAK
jgi:hypothetical protein